MYTWIYEQKGKTGKNSKLLIKVCMFKSFSVCLLNKKLKIIIMVLFWDCEITNNYIWEWNCILTTMFRLNFVFGWFKLFCNLILKIV